MATRGPWSVKGIDTKAREAALQAARSEGITLGDYLNRLLLESDEEGQKMPTQPQGRPSNDDAHTIPSETLEKLTSRIEAVEARSTLAITGMDQSIVGLLSKLENSEKSHQAMEGRLELSADDLKQTQHILEKRLERMEADDTSLQSLRALKSLETALGRLAGDLESQKDGTSQTRAQMGEIAGKVDQISGEVDAKLDTMTARMENTLESAASSVQKAVEQAELRTEGASRHLSDRMSQIESELFEEKRVHDERLTAIESKVDTTLSDVSSTVDRLGDRMEKTETAAVTASALAERLTEAESQTNDALRTLQNNVSRLDERLGDFDNEDGGALSSVSQELDAKLQAVSEELANSVASIRSELAEQIESASNVPAEAFIEINHAVSEVHKRAKLAERRQNQALESIGEEVTKLTMSLDKRVSQIEQRNDSDLTSTVRDQIDDMSSSLLKRIQDIETREPADNAALENVTEQMSSLADTLDKRVTDSEERSANAIREFTEHMSTISRNLSAKQEKGLSQISSQIQESEKRQSDRLQQALSGVQDRISQVEQATSSSVSPIQKAMSSLAERLSAVEDFATPPGVAKPAATPMDFGNFEDALDKHTPEKPKAEPEPDTFDASTLEGFDTPSSEESWDSDSFPDIPEPDIASTPEPAEKLAVDDDPWANEEEFFGDLGNGNAETQSDQFSDMDDQFGFDGAPDTSDDDFPSYDTNSTSGGADYLAQARAAANAGSDSKSGRKSPKQNYKSGSSKFPIIAAGTVLALTAAGTVAFMNMRGKQDAAPEFISEPAGFSMEEPSPPPIEIDEAPGLTAEAASIPAESEPADNAAITIEKPEAPAKAPTPPPSNKPAAVKAEQTQPEARTPAPKPDAKPAQAAPSRPAPAKQPPNAAPALPTSLVQYQQGMTALNNGNIAEAATLIRAAADAGQPIAQYRLSKLYERGQGVPRDLAQSRAWTERAANGGNVKAMHDLAVFYAEGEGGQQSYQGAVQWFRQAADYGLVDSQYNLGVLYEEGLGVTANPAEALYWFRVAAKMGDAGATPKINELAQQVAPEDAARTAQLADNYRPQPNNPTANGRFTPAASQPKATPGSTSSGTDQSMVSEAQTLLNSLGFNVGVADGKLGLQTRDAILSFQAANNLPQSGSVTPTLIRQLRIAAS